MDRNDRSVTAFTMLGHATFHTYELVIPIFVVLWLDVFETTPAVIGAIVGLSYALTGIGALPSGVLSDRIGAKRLIVGCMLGMGAGFLVIGIAPTMPVLAVGLMLWGVAASIYHPAGLTLLSRATKERGKAFAYHGAAGNVGVATGPLLAAVLLVAFGWRTVVILLLVPVLLAIGLSMRLEFDEFAGVEARSPSDDDRRSIGGTDPVPFASGSALLFTGGFVLVFVIGILYGLYYRGVVTFLPDILAGLPMFDPVSVRGRPIEPAQYVYSGLLVLGGVGQYVGGVLVDRVRAEYALIGTFVLLAGTALLFVPAANAGIVPLLVVSGLLGFLVFMEAPINQEVISKYVPADLRGLSFGYVYVAIFGVGAIGSALAGYVLTVWNAAVLFVIVAIFATAAAGLGFLLTRHDRSESTLVVGEST